jgi:manganese/zinc/iron transport system permease protein
MGLFDDFTLRTIALGALVLGLTSGVLGVFALLRRQSLLGDVLSHAPLPGVCLGYLVTGSRSPLAVLSGALVASVLAALLTLYLSRATRIKEDAAQGAVLSFFFAVGTVLLTFIQGRNDAGQSGLDSFLFGQAAAMLPEDVVAMSVVGFVAIGAVLLLWKELKLVSFDPDFASSIGLPTVWIEAGITALVAFAVVIGLEMVGVVLMSAMLIAPAAAARQWTDRLGVMVVLAALLAATAGVTGASLSARGEGLATGPVIVLIASALALGSLLVAPRRGIIARAWIQARTRRLLERRAVLIGLYRLAEGHDDRAYLAEQGMVNVLFGADTRRVLARLEHDELVARAEHMAEEGRHWVLTRAGRAEAERAIALLGDAQKETQ